MACKGLPAPRNPSTLAATTASRPLWRARGSAPSTDFEQAGGRLMYATLALAQQKTAWLTTRHAGSHGMRRNITPTLHPLTNVWNALLVALWCANLTSKEQQLLFRLRSELCVPYLVRALSLSQQPFFRQARFTYVFPSVCARCLYLRFLIGATTARSEHEVGKSSASLCEARVLRCFLALPPNYISQAMRIHTETCSPLHATCAGGKRERDIEM